MRRKMMMVFFTCLVAVALYTISACSNSDESDGNSSTTNSNNDTNSGNLKGFTITNLYVQNSNDENIDTLRVGEDFYIKIDYIIPDGYKTSIHAVLLMFDGEVVSEMANMRISTGNEGSMSWFAGFSFSSVGTHTVSAILYTKDKAYRTQEFVKIVTVTGE